MAMDQERRSTGASPGRRMPAGLPGLDALDQRRSTENFPVALRLLPARARDDLVAIYGFARLVDEIGDAYPGDRLAALDWVEGDLEAIAHGEAIHPAVRRLAPTIQRHDIGLGPCRDLIEANRRDQWQTHYATFDDLVDYCHLSADPVGRMVLAVFGVADPRAGALSDHVCTALQVIEHIQDVGEDAAAGRVYLPADDLARAGCSDDDVHQAITSAGLRSVLRVLCERAAALLDSGPPLLRLVTGSGRLAVAGFVAGGWATIDAVEATDFDVLGRTCRPSKRRTAVHMARLLLGRHGTSR
jgi:squalene synthase HpnC